MSYLFNIESVTADWMNSLSLSAKGKGPYLYQGHPPSSYSGGSGESAGRGAGVRKPAYVEMVTF